MKEYVSPEVEIICFATENIADFVDGETGVESVPTVTRPGRG